MLALERHCYRSAFVFSGLPVDSLGFSALANSAPFDENTSRTDFENLAGDPVKDESLARSQGPQVDFTEFQLADVKSCFVGEPGVGHFSSPLETSGSSRHFRSAGARES